MILKKRLARTIVADFHGEEAALRADEGWAKQFQRDETPEDVEEVEVAAGELGWSAEQPSMRADKLLVKIGLAESASDATRKVKQGAVRVGGTLLEGTHVMVPSLPLRLVVRAGKRAKAALLR
jgi:tyrosyl-tRNA synthetase